MKSGYPSFLEPNQVSALDLLVERLATASVHERHFWATSWNWDYYAAPLQAIADRSDTALETVAHIYWVGNAEEFLIQPAAAALASFDPGLRPDDATIFRTTMRQIETQDDPYFKQMRLGFGQLLATIVLKANEGAYPRMGWELTSGSSFQKDRARSLSGELPFAFPSRLIGPFSGQPFDDAPYRTRENLDLLEVFGVHWFELDELPEAVQDRIKRGTN